MNCPALIELLSDPLPQGIENHIQRCPRCRALRRAGVARTEVSDLRLDASGGGRPPALERADEISPGSVVTAVVEGSDQRLTVAVVDLGHDQLTVAPISSEVRMATNWDLLLDADALGYPAMAELWNIGEILAEQVFEDRGALPQPARDWLLRLSQLALQSGEVPGDTPVGVDVISDEDPRLLFQEAEAEVAERFWHPSLVLSGVESLGELMAARAEELELEAEALENWIEPAKWRELIGDRLDVEDVPVATMAALMRTLDVPLYARVKAIIKKAVAANCQAYEPSLILARRRRGSRREARRPSPEECERRGQIYVEKLAQHLEQP